MGSGFLKPGEVGPNKFTGRVKSVGHILGTSTFEVVAFEAGWGGDDNILVQNTSFAFVSDLFGSGEERTNSLLSRGMFTSNPIPGYATIVGVEVQLRALVTVTGSLEDGCVGVGLFQGSLFMGPIKCKVEVYNGTQSTQTYGGPTDLWGTGAGTPLTPANMNAANFGVGVLLVRNGTDPSDDFTISAEWLKTKVWYR